MYEAQAEAKMAAYQTNQYVNQGAAIVGNALGNKQPVIAQAMLQELQSLLEKSRMIESRQINLKDRIFGPQPCGGVEGGLKDVPPNGFLHEANAKIQALHVTLDRVIQNCVELERLA